MPNVNHAQSATDFDRLYPYSRAVDDATAKWNSHQKRVYSELQLNIANAHAQAAEAYRCAGWDRWEAVHATTVKLYEALATGEGVPHAYSAYYAALGAFDQERREDCRAMQEKIQESVNGANELAQEALQQGYSVFVDALEEARNLQDPENESSTEKGRESSVKKTAKAKKPDK